MAKLDEVSLEIGKLKSSTSSIITIMDRHHKESMGRFDRIDKHFAQINGTLYNNKKRLDKLENDKWTIKRLSKLVTLIATIFGIIVYIVNVIVNYIIINVRV